MIIMSEFKPAWWLLNAHAQTILPAFARKTRPPIDSFERVELADGDFVDLAWSNGGLDVNAPLVILLHGLGGNFQSTYVGGFMRAFQQFGWRSVLMHFRGAGLEPNRLPRAYHSGDTADLDFVLQFLAKKEPNTPKAAVGVSLGGNVLLKWLGENSNQNILAGAVAISVPFELRLVANKLNLKFSRIYQWYLLKKLKNLFERKKQSLPQVPKILEESQQWDCFWTFDEYVTAPLHGFSNAHSYYRQSSSRSYLKNIKTKTLIIHSLDDPFMTKDIIPTPEELSDSIRLEVSKKGGHAGFISGFIPGKPVYWLEKRVPLFLKTLFEN